MKTIYIDYPLELSFKTNKVFTDYEQRTEFLQELLEKKQVDSPLHHYTDYVVEFVEYTKDAKEYWVVGS